MLTDEEIDAIGSERSPYTDFQFARAIESAATAPLLARIAELEAANEAFGKRQEWWNARMLELEQQLAEARKDAERLDYIQKNARNDPKMDGNHVWWPTTFNKALKGPTIRAAIDAAIKENHK